jgi:branched-chain amino acid transport system substrate-binding protein
MSHKNETTVLVLSLLVTAVLVGGGFWLLTHGGIKSVQENPAPSASSANPSDQISDQISMGEKSLLPGKIQPEKQAGVKAIAAGDSSKAITELQSALSRNRNDPETLIFLNNARVDQQQSYRYTIAVSVPIGSDVNGSLEILRGVAQAQQEVNQAGGINGMPLKVAIANDDNNPETAKRIAATLIKNPNVVGVVGPYASDVTLAAGPVYQSGSMVAISPVSTSVKLSGFSPYIFRTVPSDYVAARALANYMLTKLQKKTAAVFFNSQSGYSQSLKSEFSTALALEGGQVTAEFDLSDSSFSAARSIDQAIKQNTQVLMLASNTSTLDKALQVVQVNRKRLNLLGGDDVYASKTLEVGGEAALGMVVAVPWHIEGNSTTNFPKQSRQLWGADVNWRTALSYDATKALAAALQRRPSRWGVHQALAAPDFSAVGASRTVRFLPSGDRNAPVQLVTIVRGQRSGTGYDFVPVPR